MTRVRVSTSNLVEGSIFKVQAYMISDCNQYKPGLCAQSSGMEDE